MQRDILTAFICLFTFCGQPFSILDSASQYFVSGRKESGRGVNYEIRLVAKKSSKKLEFNHMISKGDTLSIKLKSSRNKFIKEFSKGDTLYLYSSRSIKSPDNRREESRKYEQLELVYRYKDKTGTANFSPKRITKKNYK